MRLKRQRFDEPRWNSKGEPWKRSRFSRKRAAAALLFFVAIVACALLLARSGKRTAEMTLQRAAEAWDSENYQLAAEEYENYLAHNAAGEQAQEARFQLANIYYLNLKLYERALEHYKEFLSQAPSHPRAGVARERLAEALAELGRSYEAISEYENLEPQEPNERRRIRLRIADLYFDQKNYSQALTEYVRVTEGSNYDDLSEQAYMREASVYHIMRGQYQQALPIYQTLASQSNDPKVRLRALYGIADCYAGLYQFDEAIKTLREIKADSEQGYINRRMAELERQKREAAQARSALQP